MVRLQDGLVFTGALTLWLADRMIEQALTPRGQIKLAMGAGTVALCLVGVLYATTGHMWASSLSLQGPMVVNNNQQGLSASALPHARAGKRHKQATFALDTPAMLSVIDDVNQGINAQRQQITQQQQQRLSDDTNEAMALLASTSADASFSTAGSGGRFDPFEPLIKPIVVSPLTASGLPKMPKPKPIDPMRGLSFAGTVGEASGTSTVGIFKLFVAGKGIVAQIKRLGEAVILPNGQQAIFKGVGRDTALLSFNGQQRVVGLQPYNDDDATATATATPVMTASSASTGTPPRTPIVNLGGMR
jgi:hypothetical protein